MNSLNCNLYRNEPTIKYITNMQNKVLGEINRIKRLPVESTQRKSYVKSILDEQRKAGIITENNKLTKAFGG